MRLADFNLQHSTLKCHMLTKRHRSYCGGGTTKMTAVNIESVEHMESAAKKMKRK